LTGPDGWLDCYEPRTLIGLQLRGIMELAPTSAPDTRDGRALTFGKTASACAGEAFEAYLDLRGKHPPWGPACRWTG